MKSLGRASIAALVLALFPILAMADCKQCDGRYCNSVRDLHVGNDGCHISSETTYHWGTNGVWWETKYKCDPVGDTCTNLHVDLTVTPTFEQGASQ